MPEEVFKALTDLRRPVDTEVFDLVVYDRFRTTLSFLKVAWDRGNTWDKRHLNGPVEDDPVGRYFRRIFLPRLLHMMQNLADEAVGCLDIAVDWYTTTKTELLHRDEDFFGCSANQQLDNFLLRTFYGWKKRKTPTHGEELYCKLIPFVGAAEACREIREWARDMLACPIHHEWEVLDKNYGRWDGFDRDGCVQSDFVAAYNIFERQAYAEIKRNVYHIVGLRLPRELTDMVFDYALIVEDIPKDLTTYNDFEPDFEVCGGDQYVQMSSRQNSCPRYR